LLVQRQQHRALELGQIEALLLVSMHAVLPGSLLGKAMDYLASRWMKLALYVTDGAYPIDNHA
jgi:transposase